MVEDAEAGLGSAALDQAAGRHEAVVAAKIAEHAHGAIPAHAAAHDRAFVNVVAAVGEAESQGVVAAPAATESLEKRFRPLAAVEGLAADQALLSGPKSRAKPRPHQ